jgi:hypothetical protein
MAKKSKTDWHESDFERWFAANPYLPGGERVLLVGRHQPIRRMVDLIAVDAHGGLVILEVKNESSNRRAIGQALEYLSHYDDLTIDGLLEEDDESSPDDFLQAFHETFKTDPPELTSRRRVYLVAPSHDNYSAVCTRYLSRYLSSGDVAFHLLRAMPTAEGFELEQFECPPLVRTSALEQGFARSGRGRLFYVLVPGASPVLWSVGRMRDSDGAILFGAKPSRRTLRIIRWHLMPIEQPEQVDLTQSGTVWEHKQKPGRFSKLIGRVRLGPTGSQGHWYVVFAAFRGAEFRTFRTRPAAEFRRDWQRSDHLLPDWRAIAGLAQEQVDVRKAAAKARKRLKRETEQPVGGHER